ncbi:carbohydrate ABC transporter permease [Vibrio diazotrophicus]|uniref:carbohydrate ABC transporter permease n=1 Tax=Vibrio diazotrophicus TaxID=685 RepID=UPI00142D6D94|nr:carbohydrate ABC transporter permease [Vibrio diazotrophicus]
MSATHSPTMKLTASERPMSVKAQWGRFGVYGFLTITALFFLLPLYVMLVTSFKELDEIRLSSIFALPQNFSWDAWKVAWSSACTGLQCNGLQVGFWNSVRILIPSVVTSVLFGAINGYALSFWKIKGANLLFACLLLGAFIPYQVFIYPLIRVYADIGIYGTLTGVVVSHVIFGMPIMTLLFRNYYSTLPMELFNAARIDGAGFFKVFFNIMLPMSVPIIIVAVIMQVTNIWNDFLIGLVFAGNDNLPMTVQLNNIVNTTTGERAYNVNMAATILTSLVPLIIYVASGRWFVRGIASGAVKG